MRPIIASLAAVLLLLASFAPVATAQTAPDCTQAAFVRIIQASPDVGPVDVLVGTTPVATNLAFQAVSGFTQVAPGTVQLFVRQAGKTETVITPVDVTLAPGSRTTITITGRLMGAGQQPASSLVTTVFPGELVVPAAGQARVRFISLADVGAVDVLVNDQPIATNIAVGAASTGVDLPAGKVTVRVVKTGTTENIIGPTEIDLVAGRTITLFTSGVTADNTLVTNLAVEQSFDAQARFVHASPNAPALDVIADGRAIISNLAFPNATQYVPVPSGGACVVLAPTGQTTPAIAPVALTLEAGSKSTVVAFGLQGGAADQALQVKAFSDTTPAPAADKAKIRVIHAIPDAGAVDVLSGETVVIANLAYGAASDFIEVNTGEFKVKVNKAGSTENVLPEATLSLTAGQIVTLIARGTLADKTIGLTILSDVSGG